jgi:DNA-binding MarR family transcriptional regulator
MVHPEQLPRYLRYIANLYQKAVCRELNVPELNNHFDLLLTIDRYKQQLTQKQLGELIYTDKSTMVGIINFLCEHGFIDVKQNPLDRRENFVSLSDKGKEAVAEIKRTESIIYNTMLRGIDKDKASSLFEVLTSIELKLKQINIDINE